MNEELKKELNVKQIFDISFQVYKKNFFLIFNYLLGINVIIWLLEIIFIIFIYLNISEGFYIGRNIVRMLIRPILTGSTVIVFTSMVESYFRNKVFGKRNFFYAHNVFLKYVITSILHSLIIAPLLIISWLSMLTNNATIIVLTNFITLSVMIYIIINFIFYANIVSHVRFIWGLNSLRYSRLFVRGFFFKTFLIAIVAAAFWTIFTGILNFLVYTFVNLQGIGRSMVLEFFSIHLYAYVSLTIATAYINRCNVLGGKMRYLILRGLKGLK